MSERPVPFPAAGAVLPQEARPVPAEVMAAEVTAAGEGIPALTVREDR